MPSVSEYPRPGQVALLCEGDLVGYEATLFGKWTDEQFGSSPLVDIWPCGTAGALIGVSDAIGRRRPVLIVEDRDFRPPKESRDDCRRKRADRQRRGVRVIEWHAWARNEIENYLLEPEVALPVFRAAFGCSEDDVAQSLDEVLQALGLFQAAQYAMGRARVWWGSSDPSVHLLSGLLPRPRWDDDNRRVLAPESGEFRGGLETNHEQWRGSTHNSQCDVLAAFDEQYELWANCRYENRYWRSDWSGKEVLQWLRIVMTGRFGWPDPGSGGRRILNWNVGRVRMEEQDRPIEAALRPRLVDQLLASMPGLAGDIRAEFDEMKTGIESQTT